MKTCFNESHIISGKTIFIGKREVWFAQELTGVLQGNFNYRIIEVKPLLDFTIQKQTSKSDYFLTGLLNNINKTELTL